MKHTGKNFSLGLILTALTVPAMASPMGDVGGALKGARKGASKTKALEGAPATAASSSNPFLWKIDGKAPSYLFGTIHLADPRVKALAPSVKAALKTSQALYTELEMDTLGSSEIARAIAFPKGQTARDFLNAEQTKRLEDYLKSQDKPVEKMMRFKIWFLTLQLGMGQKQGTVKNGLALDSQLYQDAAAAGKEVGGLETQAEQMAIFNLMPMREQVRRLEKALDALEADSDVADRGMEELVLAYIAGDDAKMMAFYKASMADNNADGRAYETRMMLDRNIRMSDRIDAKLSASPEKSYFFAVGTYHTLDSYGIVDILRKKGYTVTRVGATAQDAKTAAKMGKAQAGERVSDFRPGADTLKTNAPPAPHKSAASAAKNGAAAVANGIVDGVDFMIKNVLHTSLRGVKDERAVSFGNTSELFIDPKEFYPKMFETINKAKKEVNVQFMTFEPDAAGRPIAEALMKKAQEGVKVRVLMDDYNLMRLVKYPKELLEYRKMIAEMKAAGVDVAASNPLRGWNFLFRHHRKMVIADGKTAMTGGYNPADHNYTWHDLMVAVEGPAAGQMQEVFLKTFKHFGGTVSEEELKAAKNTPKMLGLDPTKGKVEVVTTSSSKAERSIKHSVLEKIATAEKSVRLENAYFTDRDILKALKAAARRGVKVDMIVPGKNAWGIAAGALKYHYQSLVDAGIQIYEYQGMTHAKVTVVDSKWASVGSANFDNLSFKHQDNLNINIEDPALARDIETRMLDADIANSVKVTPENVGKAKGSLPVRIISRILDGVT